MTMPLVVLGLLALFGGLLGIAPPIAHLLHLPHGWVESITQWLAPAVYSSAGWNVPGETVLVSPISMVHAPGTEWGLMGASVMIFVVGTFVAWVLYFREIHPFAKTFASERPWRWLYVRVRDKWHVDELYDTIAVKPIGWGSKVLLYEGLDKRVIDGAVNLVGWLARSIGFFGQLFQSGNIQRYLAIFAIALAILFWGWMDPKGCVPDAPDRAEEAMLHVQDGNGAVR
jgi:NADH:ubiquinone oxidoreductase subunit 5 (subunit L)/multisubunit Na+/H+ antiporter MnhA subunit